MAHIAAAFVNSDIRAYVILTDMEPHCFGWPGACDKEKQKGSRNTSKGFCESDDKINRGAIKLPKQGEQDD